MYEPKKRMLPDGRIADFFDGSEIRAYFRNTGGLRGYTAGYYRRMLIKMSEKCESCEYKPKSRR